MKRREVQIDLTRDEKREGLHLSSIIKSILVGLDPKRFGGGLTSSSYARFEVGYALEDMLTRRRLERGVLLQQSVEKDGVRMTLDGLDILTPGWKVLESKATWLSLRDPAPKGKLGMPRTPDHPKFRHWIWQTMGYCHGVDTNRALLEVLFVNGDYRPSQPVLKAWELEFTPQELQENWAMVLNAKRSLQKRRRR